MGVQTDLIDENDGETVFDGGEEFFGYWFIDKLQYSYMSVKASIDQQDNKGLKVLLIILVGCIIAMFWYLQMQVL